MAGPGGARAQPQTKDATPHRWLEHLGRGVVALPRDDGTVFVSWRLLATDPEDVAFHVYRRSGADVARLTKSPITKGTWFEDRPDGASGVSYFVRPVRGGKEAEP